MRLRTYQRDSVDAIFDYWRGKPGNPLVDMATGTGKSLVLATLVQELLTGWPDMRVMVATHVAELIEQNFLELVGVWPFAPAGVYSAGLKRREGDKQIIFAGIQTVHNKAAEIGAIDVLLVDEAHLIPAKAETMYGRFIKAMRAVNPDMKIVGLTATPYRMDSGRLDTGDDRLFDETVFTYGIAQGVEDGYLAPLTCKATATELDVSSVGKLGGDYKAGALQAAVDKDEITEAAVDEIVRRGADRKSWLVFCSGVEHALHVRDEIRNRGITCETITGDTPKEERRRILEDSKAGKIRALTNNSVLTTGYNDKRIDLIAALRPSKSVSLYVQIMGRGTRPLYAPGMPLETPEQRKDAIAAGPKPNCLVLDFARLVDEHGPVDMVEAKTPGKGDGEAPIKICPQDEGGCGEKVHASARVCPCCGREFEIDTKPKITARATDAPIMSTAPPELRTVSKRVFRYHEGRDGKPDTVKIAYMTGLSQINEWVCPAHEGFAKTKADRHWGQHGGELPAPSSPLEWIERQAELSDTLEIKIKADGRYWRVLSHVIAGGAVADMPAPVVVDMEDEIPF